VIIEAIFTHESIYNWIYPILNIHKSKYKMIGRATQIRLMQDVLKLKKSSFVAITGRRRAGKSLIEGDIYASHFAVISKEYIMDLFFGY